MTLKRSELHRRTSLKSSRSKRGRRGARNQQRLREAIYTYACDIPGEPATCWLARLSGKPCGGTLTKAHLISKQAIRKEIWNRKLAEPDLLWPEDFPATLRHLQDDPRCWVPACWAHHQALDIARTLRVTREQLPPAVESYAAEYGVVWWLEREYGPLVREAVGV